jgi:two-component system sensor histidine kinase RegB
MLETLQSTFEPPISADPGESKAKLAWLVRLRWIALAAQLLSILPALEFEVLQGQMLPPFLSVIAALALVNIITWAALKRGTATHPRHVFFQLAADIVALSSLLALSGGAWNPLMPILFVHMGLGALLLEGRLSLLLFSLMLLCIGLNQAWAQIPPGLETSLLPAHLLFPAQFVMAGVFWILTTWLSRTLTALQAQAAFLSERKTRIDRLRAVGALAAGLSHEFATPLNTAKLKLARLARTQNLATDSDWATASDALERCEDILRRMSGSQLEPEGLQLEAVDVAILVERMCDSASQADRRSGSPKIRFTYAGRTPRRALLPALAFSHAILNLLDNARESTDGQGEIEVVVSGRVGRVEVSILDRGPGWPEVVRRHFGEPFITTKPDGVGLGLYYVHNLSEAIGAELSLEDREQGGAIARISLPILLPAGETATT